MLKKFMAVFIVAMLALWSFVGCGPKGPNQYGDKIVIQVGIYNGGWGQEWLDKAAAEFEKKNPQYKVLVDGDKKYYMSTLLGTIDVLPQDVFVAPVYLYDYLSQDLLMDVTTEMTTPLKDLGIGVSDEESIADKMWEDLDEFYKGYNNLGKYFAAPFGGGIYGISYDIDLFEGKGFYYDASGNWTKGTEGTQPKSVGQDGIAGTYDDGLPVTIDEFWNLCNYMVNEGVTPFIWSDQTSYTCNLIYSMYAAYEGKANFDLVKTMSGKYTFEGDSEPTKITPQNAYLLMNMTGRKKALEFAYTLANNPDYYHSQSGTASMSFMTTQSEYLLSVVNESLGLGKRVAFIIDGAHWYNEAKDTFNDMAAMSDEYANRRFGIMPFPKYEGSPATKATYFASSFYTSVFVKKNAKEAEGAKKFFAYLQSDEALQMCTQYSGMPRALDYEMKDEQLAAMPEYYQSLWGAFGGNSDIVYHTCANPYIYKNEQFFENDWKWKANTRDGKTLSDPIGDFRTYPTLTVDEYMTALRDTMSEEVWLSKIAVGN